MASDTEIVPEKSTILLIVNSFWSNKLCLVSSLHKYLSKYLQSYFSNFWSFFTICRPLRNLVFKSLLINDTTTYKHISGPLIELFTEQIYKSEENENEKFTWLHLAIAHKMS